MIFGGTCWFLWLYRNALIYSTEGVESWSVLSKVRNWNETVLVDGVEVVDSMEIEHAGIEVNGLNGASEVAHGSTGFWESSTPRVKASYASMVRNYLSGGQHSIDPDELTPDKVIVRDADCVVDDVCPKDQPLNASEGSGQASVSERGPRSLSVVDAGNLSELWMIVDKRRMRTQNVLSGEKRGMTIVSGSSGSRFAALDTDFMDDEQVGLVANGGSESPRVNVSSIREGELSSPSNPVQPTSTAKIEAYITSNPLKKSKASKVAASGAKVIPIKPGNPVVVVEHHSTKNASEHQAVSLLEYGHGNSTPEASMRFKNRGIKLKMAKENNRQGLMIRKPAPAKTVSCLVLTEWVENVNAQLNTIETQQITDLDVSSRLIVNQGGLLEILPPGHGRRSKGHWLWIRKPSMPRRVALLAKAINLISRSSHKGSPINLVRNITRLCGLGWQVSFRQVSRSRNKVADALAKLTSLVSFNVVFSNNPPLAVVDLLYEDHLPS
ncbi:hypothetical protein V6N11_079481 [Hibiscus sabdariffa]|uniref:RNase H type-1 domain-containing protein n=1 Tax=Hibiscus sabdariffa TaxID=183260 RepID=A0ABR2RVH8_9ROSI